jgi:hypothetical protein
MADDAARFRSRARDCRARAELADYVMRQFLLNVADDLEAEADAIDADAAKPSAPFA